MLHQVIGGLLIYHCVGGIAYYAFLYDEYSKTNEFGIGMPLVAACFALFWPMTVTLAKIQNRWMDGD
jgi:hypothetical protein